MSKSVLFTLIAFGALNLFTLVSCNEEKTDAATTEAAAAPVEAAAAPAAEVADSAMGSAETRPVDPAVKK